MNLAVFLRCFSEFSSFWDSYVAVVEAKLVLSMTDM